MRFVINRKNLYFQKGGNINVDNNLLQMLNNILQQKSNELDSNEIFSMVSLIVLSRIIDNFVSENNISLPQNVNNKDSDAEVDSAQVPANNNIANLLNQLQGAGQDGNNANIQQMLPLLLSALGNGGSNNLGGIMNLLQNSKKPQNNNTNKEGKEEENKTEQREALDNNEKKKNNLNKRKLDWSRLKL